MLSTRGSADRDKTLSGGWLVEWALACRRAFSTEVRSWSCFFSRLLSMWETRTHLVVASAYFHGEKRSGPFVVGEVAKGGEGYGKSATARGREHPDSGLQDGGETYGLKRVAIALTALFRSSRWCARRYVGRESDMWSSRLLGASASLVRGNSRKLGTRSFAECSTASRRLCSGDWGSSIRDT